MNSASTFGVLKNVNCRENWINFDIYFFKVVRKGKKRRKTFWFRKYKINKWWQAMKPKKNLYCAWARFKVVKSNIYGILINSLIYFTKLKSAWGKTNLSKNKLVRQAEQVCSRFYYKYLDLPAGHFDSIFSKNNFFPLQQVASCWTFIFHHIFTANDSYSKQIIIKKTLTIFHFACDTITLCQ